MNIFLSKYINNLDKKGRVSIPASYRVALSSQSFNGIIAYPSFRNKCIECCSLKRLEELSQIIQTLDPYSEVRDAFETIILAEAIQLSFDSEGRVILPKSLIDHADISDQACFVGKGLIFEIWQPQNFETYLSSARQIAQSNRLTLKNIKDVVV
ncbi:division/cell wall cluster transcriptional repressor MraZ [Candidatus Tisiphia endosymbiont of Nedyus quadrimaculatus]|uniref:division/cell wall cluster transcriptional repressor MraZ n=1 Tax=Candidatus Tisiphia endosymbiont of Nedyus quadrimaculatus TaxID=3139332 RepID=UPI00345EBC10